MNTILVISSNYPSDQSPQVGTFVYKLIQEFVALGNSVVVVSPKKYRFKEKVKIFYGEENATVFRPKRLSFSNKKIGFINTFFLTNYFQGRAIKKTVDGLEHTPDIVYCHFIISAINYFQAYPNSTIPVFVAVGEYRNIDIVRQKFSSRKYLSFLNRVRGFIAVSHQVEEKLISLGVPQTKIIVEPNATDLNKFKPRNKNELRIKYNLPLDKRIVLFVGRFLDNKGPLRVKEALSLLEDDVAAIYIGRGPQQVEHPRILFSGAVEHHIVAEYMSLSDVFVLPTLHEGSSNVIVEAMASGLPIVSSDIPEIRAQCNPGFATLVDPMDVAAIADALKDIVSDDELRFKMSSNALKASRQFDIRQRAERILNFIDERFEKNI